jgi:hypothetical protein
MGQVETESDARLKSWGTERSRIPERDAGGYRHECAGGTFVKKPENPAPQVSFYVASRDS